MAVFGGLILTNDGRNLEAKAQLGKKLTFKRIALGDGQISTESMWTMKNLKNEVLSVDINNMQILQNNIVTLTFILSNQKMTEGFWWRELGVIAVDPDTSEEVLFCYGNARENAEYISSYNEQDIIEKYVNVDLSISNVDNLNVTIDKSLIFAKQTDVNDIKKQIKKEHYVLIVEETITKDKDYVIPLKYQVGNNSLEVYYMGEKLIKSTDDFEGHYKEIGDEGTISNIIQLDGWDADVDEYFEFVVKGVYEDET